VQVSLVVLLLLALVVPRDGDEAVLLAQPFCQTWQN
jgi:hypothetical protein